MRLKTLLVSVVLLTAGLAGHAQTPLTQFYARFVYDDGTAVAGGLQIFRGVAPNAVNIFGMALDANGRVQGALPLDASQSYYGTLNFTDSGGKQVSLGYNEAPFCMGTCAQPVIAALPLTEVVVTIAKATDTVAGMTLGPVPPPPSLTLPQIKFSTCVSTPAYQAPPNPTLYNTTDAGGGQAAGYVVPGETFDCTVSTPAAGTYQLNVRAESPDNSVGIHFEYPLGTKVGAEATVEHTIPYWGASEAFGTFPAGTVALPQGTVKIRVVVDATSKWMVNLNWFN